MAKKQAAHPRRKAASSSSELDNECAAILKLASQEEDQHFQIGVHFNRIVDGKLYKDAGFKTAAECVSQRLGGLSHGTLSLYGSIAKAFSEEVATKYGSVLLGELLAYEKATHAPLPSGDPGQVPIKVPSEGGSTKEKRFADCSVKDLRAALHKLRVPHEPPLPRDDKATLDGLNKVMQRQLGTTPPIAMHARRDPKRETTFVFLTLPIEYLEPLRDVLVATFGKADLSVQRHGRRKSATPMVANGKNGRHWSGRNGQQHTSGSASIPVQGTRRNPVKHRHTSPGHRA